MIAESNVNRRVQKLDHCCIKLFVHLREKNIFQNIFLGLKIFVLAAFVALVAFAKNGHPFVGAADLFAPPFHIVRFAFWTPQKSFRFFVDGFCVWFCGFCPVHLANGASVVPSSRSVVHAVQQQRFQRAQVPARVVGVQIKNFLFGAAKIPLAHGCAVFGRPSSDSAAARRREVIAVAIVCYYNIHNRLRPKNAKLKSGQKKQSKLAARKQYILFNANNRGSAGVEPRPRSSACTNWTLCVLFER